MVLFFTASGLFAQQESESPVIAVKRMDEAMDRTPGCIFCGKTEAASEMGLWVVGDTWWPIHATCWVSAYERGRLNEVEREQRRA